MEEHKIAKTFKQQVEEIIELWAYKISPRAKRGLAREILTAHNAELDRIAKGMQTRVCNPTYWEILQLKADQAYIQAQKGS